MNTCVFGITLLPRVPVCILVCVGHFILTLLDRQLYLSWTSSLCVESLHTCIMILTNRILHAIVFFVWCSLILMILSERLLCRSDFLAGFSFCLFVYVLFLRPFCQCFLLICDLYAKQFCKWNSVYYVNTCDANVQKWFDLFHFSRISCVHKFFWPFLSVVSLGVDRGCARIFLWAASRLITYSAQYWVLFQCVLHPLCIWEAKKTMDWAKRVISLPLCLDLSVSLSLSVCLTPWYPLSLPLLTVEVLSLVDCKHYLLLLK